MKKNLMRLTAVAALALGSTVSATIYTQEPASAATYGWVYISMPTWLGNCPQGSIKWMQLTTGPWTGGDYGDDLVYAKVALNQTNRVQGQGMCYVGNRPVTTSVPFSVTIKPTRNKQTWWVGPAGTRSN